MLTGSILLSFEWIATAWIAAKIRLRHWTPSKLLVLRIHNPTSLTKAKIIMFQTCWTSKHRLWLSASAWFERTCSKRMRTRVSTFETKTTRRVSSSSRFAKLILSRYRPTYRNFSLKMETTVRFKIQTFRQVSAQEYPVQLETPHEMLERRTCWPSTLLESVVKNKNKKAWSWV